MDSEGEVNSQYMHEHLGVSAYLDSADEARRAGRARLAVHLYCAAFELAIEQGLTPTDRLLDGMNQAWLLACEQGDHSSAEAIFNDMLPYHSPEQTEEALKQLQHLAMQQLEKLGMSHHEVLDLAQSLAEEITQSSSSDLDTRSLVTGDIANRIDLNRIFEGFESQLLELNKAAEASKTTFDLGTPAEASTNTFDLGKATEVSATTFGLGTSTEMSSATFEHTDDQMLSYDTITGFTETLRTMRQFGFKDTNDPHFSEFVAQASALHGLTAPVLTDTFLFYGPDRDDVALFAKATAGEIGWPIIEIAVEIETGGLGTIKVSGPIKRSFLGAPRLTDLPRPCTLLIQNIDVLQQLFRGEEQAWCQRYRLNNLNNPNNPFNLSNPTNPNNPFNPYNPNNPHRDHDSDTNPQCFRGSQGVNGIPFFGPAPAMGPGLPRSIQAEVLGYFNILCARGEVFIIATAAEALGKRRLLCDGLMDVLGTFREIEVPAPTLEERAEILRYFAQEHPSFNEIAFENLAALAQGVSRNELVWAAQSAVEETYRKSLRTKRHQMVTLGEMLTQLIIYIDADSPYYQKIEDTIIEQFRSEIDEDLQNMT